MSSAAAWLLATRPKTLPAAVVPVAVGAACANAQGQLQLWPTLGALAGALLLQIGSNFANDVYDYEKGADTDARLGPLRTVQAGLISAQAMKLGMTAVFVLAILVGVYLFSVAGWAILVIGVASIVSAIAYTGGPYPLGYHGLGDLFVMVFFGFVAVCGTAFVNTGGVPLSAWLSSVPVGALATAILVVNNVRDYETDRLVGKRTLVVRLGPRAGIAEYALLLFIAYLTPILLFVSSQALAWVLLPLLTLPVAVQLLRAVAGRSGSSLNLTLAHTAKLLLGFGVLFSAGLAAGTPGGG